MAVPRRHKSDVRGLGPVGSLGHLETKRSILGREMKGGYHQDDTAGHHGASPKHRDTLLP
jgi:hypothetical protein